MAALTAFLKFKLCLVRYLIYAFGEAFGLLNYTSSFAENTSGSSMPANEKSTLKDTELLFAK